MLDFNLARELKEAGLKWKPELHDFFAIPERGMDTRVFVISDMLVNIERLLGSQVVAFQGASEWALDYLVTSEAVWIPREDQLRSFLEQHLREEIQPALRLSCASGRCHLEITFQGQTLAFDDPGASAVYGQALLFILQNSPAQPSEEDQNPLDLWERGLPGEQEV